MEQLEFSPRVEELLDILRNGNASAKRDATRLFHQAAEAGDLSPDWIADLCGLLNDPCTDVRRLAVETLARLGPAAAAATMELLAIYAVEEDDLWIEAATALSHIGTAALPELAIALQQSQASIRRAALEVLGSLCRPEDPIVEQMIECLHDADADVRHAAADAMATCGARMPETCAAA
jgi:HEAT repeat protein